MIGKNDELISRQMAIKSMTNTIWHYPNELYSDLNAYPNAEALAKYGLEYLPSVQPTPFQDWEKIILSNLFVRKGKWIYGEHDVTMCDGYRCNKCGFFVPWDYQHQFISFIKEYNFCPNCGADMRGEQDE